MPREWNAETYHRVSNPQFEWGQAVLARLPLAGDELVVDIGCGTGRLTTFLLQHLPRGAVVAVDMSANMLRVAAETLAATGGRFVVVQAEAAALPLHGSADAVFSTATFHWVLDHNRLFASVHAALKPGGRFVAQCGGGPNIARLHERAAVLMRDVRFARWFGGWRDPWEFADVPTTVRRLEAAGFADIDVALHPAPTVLADAEAFRVFVTNVICHPYLPYLPNDDERAAFVEALTAQAAGDDPPFELDYHRLNISARKR